jgi:hypothetical protein
MLKKVFFLILIFIVLFPCLNAEGRRSDIIQLAIKINGLLSKYIDVHNYIFHYSPNRVTFDLSKLEKIDFDSSYKKIVKIHSDITSCNEKIPTLARSSQKKEEFIIQLDKYSKALIKTITIFEQILFNLNAKTKNPLKYNYEEYNRQMKLYKKSIAEYTELGRNLSKLYEEFIKQEDS